MTSAAPVCPISRDQALAGQPQATVPGIPRAVDLPSLIAAVNAIRQLLIAPTPLNNMPYRGFVAPNTANIHGGVTIGPPSWFEGNRIVDQVEVVHTDMQTREVDTKQRVEVQRIWEIDFYDTNSSNVWSWIRSPVPNAATQYARTVQIETEIASFDEGGGDNPEYKEDFFQTIINVSWGKGLAVEFFDGSS